MLPLDIVSLNKSEDVEIGNAFRLFQLGQYQWALDAFDRATSNETEKDDCRLLRREIARYLDPSIRDEPRRLIWQVAPDCWESDWIRFLFAESHDEEIHDGAHDYKSKRMIVVDNLLTEEKSKYYRDACLSGCDIILVHLSDEGFVDDVGSYKWCDRVYRNYWSRLLAHDDRITCFLLGPRRGVTGQSIVAASRRKWLWGFAGDANKSGRAEMLAEMSSLAEGYLHFTSGFASADGVPADQYERILGQSAFAPCPSGYVNLDAFRVYEALECGAIPIVERRYNFDYFEEMCGPHPMPTISSWRETPHLLARIGSGAELDQLQQRCTEWWSSMKRRLREQITRTAWHA